jgi:hypothetical protein
VSGVKVKRGNERETEMNETNLNETVEVVEVVDDAEVVEVVDEPMPLDDLLRFFRMRDLGCTDGN